jgi:hypothetical protein
VALSHCWGKTGTPCKTTKARLKQYHDEILISFLPRTFRDAIRITRELGIPYIWIDSLCIVQDDPEDWKSEAANMASIFQGAHVVIMSPMAEDCQGGFQLTNIPSSKKFNVSSSDSSNSGSKVRLFLRNLDETGSHIAEKLLKSPLLCRGWIFQEIILARRIVRIMNGQFFWKCRELYESEDCTVHQIQEGSSQYINENGGDRKWCSTINQHSSCDLTHESDSIPSLLGIMDMYQRISGDTLVVGLGRKNLALHLSWRSRHLISPNQRDYKQPTWSWTSIQHSARRVVEWHDIPFSPMRNYWESGPRSRLLWSAPITDVDIKWEARPIISTLERAVLSITKIRLPYEKGDKIEGIKGPSDFFFREPDGIVTVNDDTKYYDTVSSEQLEEYKGVDYLPLWIMHDNPSENMTNFEIFSMIIEPSPDMDNAFRRIGVTSHWWKIDSVDIQRMSDLLLDNLESLGDIKLI